MDNFETKKPKKKTKKAAAESDGSEKAHDAETDSTAVTMEEIMATDAENAGLF